MVGVDDNGYLAIPGPTKRNAWPPPEGDHMFALKGDVKLKF